MSILYILIPIAILLVTLAVVVFFWAVRSGQFEDLERHGTSILFDEDKKKPIRITIKMNAESLWLAALLIGMAGSVHCVAMCGGIVGALTFSIPAQKPALPYVLSYHAGRIFSYSIAGALTGSLGAIFSHQVSHGLVVLNLFGGLFLIALGLYIGDWWRGLVILERLGGKIWKPLVPLSKKFLPFKHPLAALPYGVIWGWLPCGLVYSTLSWSLASGSAFNGALVMALFGLGTLPALVSLGVVSHKLKPLLSHRLTKKIIALCLLGFGLYMLLNQFAGQIETYMR